MGNEAFHCNGYESPTSEAAIPWYGRGAGRDQCQAGSGAKIDYAAHPVSPQGSGDGGS